MFVLTADLAHALPAAPIMAAGVGSDATATLMLSVAFAGIGVLVILRVIAVITAIVQALIRMALSVGTVVLVVGLFGSMFGITYLGQALGF